MLVISEFLLQEIRPLAAQLIYEPNNTHTMSAIVEKLTAFGGQVPTLLSEGKIDSDYFHQYTAWLKDFLHFMGSSDYVSALCILHPKTVLK